MKKDLYLEKTQAIIFQKFEEKKYFFWLPTDFWKIFKIIYMGLLNTDG